MTKQSVPYPNYVKNIGFNTALAATIEAFSNALPKGSNNPTVSQQGVIDLANVSFPLERTLVIDLTDVSTVSRAGLTIRGCGMKTSSIYTTAASSSANFKGADNVWSMINFIGNLKLPNVRFENLGVYCYFSQDGAGARLTDDAVVVDFLSCTELTINNLRLYGRTLNVKSTNQYFLKVKQCYYSSVINPQIIHFRGNTLGLDGKGVAAPERTRAHHPVDLTRQGKRRLRRLGLR